MNRRRRRGGAAAMDDGNGGNSGGSGSRRNARRNNPYSVDSRPRGGGGGGHSMATDDAAGPGGARVSLVEIFPVPQNTPLMELRTFFNAQLKNRIQWKSLKYDGTSRAVMELGSRADAKTVSRLNGVIFQRQKLTLRVVSASRGGASGAPELSSVQQNLLRPVLLERVQRSAPHVMLDLTGLPSDPRLASMAINFNDASGSAVLSFAARECPDVTALTLDLCGLTTLVRLVGLGKMWRKLTGLSLRGNALADIAELRHLKVVRGLEHLVVAGNPFADAAAASGGEAAVEAVQTAVQGMLTKLKTLDNEPLEAPVSFAVPSSIARAAEVSLPEPQQVWCDAESNQAFAVAFLNRFITDFDGKDRAQGLAEVYSENAVLSVTVTRDDVSDRKSAGGGAKVHNNGSFADFARMDRNHVNVRKEESARRVSLLHYGRDAATAALKKMPPTKHMKDGIRMDVFAATGKLVVGIHGCFSERTQSRGKTTNTTRAYDRTFVLALAQEGSRAAAAGYQVEITNDQIHVRYAPKILPKKGKGKGRDKGKGKGKKLGARDPRAPAGMPGAAQPSAIPGAAPAAQAVENPHAQLLAQQANTDVTTATQALEFAQQDYNKALQAILEFRAAGKIP